MDVCARCGHELGESPVGDPCPECGSPDRGRLVEAQVALAASADMDVSASIGYNPSRPWQQKWRDVIDGLKRLEQTYAQNDLDNEVVRRQVEYFFKDCRELADWLRHSGYRDAVNHVFSDRSLEICDGMAQTSKHHTRTQSQSQSQSQKNPDPITAQIARVYGGKGVRAEIDWTSQSGRGDTEDALRLARHCVDAWKRFFSQHGLNP